METQISDRPHTADGIMCNGGATKEEFEFNGNGGGSESEASERNSTNRGRAKKPRIIYNKDFLLECSNYPKSRRKPTDFPLPDLGCTLGAIKSLKGSKPSTPVLPQAYVPLPRRKDEGAGARRGGDTGDNISLRPHSGSFAGGCSPVLQQAQKFYDRGGSRDTRDPPGGFRGGDNNSRNFRDDRGGDRDTGDRRGGDRDGGDRRGDRNDRDRSNRDTRPEPRSFHGRWGDADGIWDDPPHHEGQQQGKWGYNNSQKNGRGDGNGPGSGHYEKKEQHGGHRDYNRRGGRDHREDPEEPEWFSGGPTSRHETMELRGFMDDERRDAEDKRNRKETATSRRREEPTTAPKKEAEEPVVDLNLSLEKILKMDSIPGLPNGLVEEEEEEIPKGTSRFTKIFQRNSANASNAPTTTTHQGEQDGMFLFEKLQNRSSSPLARTLIPTTETEGEKKEIVQELGNALRNMLQITTRKATVEKGSVPQIQDGPAIQQQNSQSPNRSSIRSPPPTALNSTPPHHHHQQHNPFQGKDVNALQALLQKIILVPNNNKPASPDNELEHHATFPRPGSDLGNPMPAFEIQQQHGNAFPVPPLNRPEHFPQMPQNIMRPPGGNMGNGGGFRPVHVNGMPMGPPQQQQQQQHVQMPFNVLENLVRPNNISQHMSREMCSPQQVMGMLPPDIQLLVQHVNADEEFWGLPDHRPLLAAITCGQFSIRSLIQDLVSASCPRRPMFAALLQIILAGFITIPSYQLIGQPFNFQKGRGPRPPHHPHQSQSHPQQQPHPAMMQRMHQPQNNRNGRPDYDMEREQSRRGNGTPVSCNMAFTPTSVMRKMTADSPKPTNQNRRATPVGHPGMELGAADFNMIVQQLTGQQHGGGTRPLIATPMPIHAAQFQPIHPLGQMMMPQSVPQNPQMMHHPFPASGPPMNNLPNQQQQHHDMPHS